MAEPTIHVIDDEDSVRDSLAMLLEAAGREVRTYESAEAFLAQGDQAAPGCIITDLRMAGMSGLDLVHHLNEIKAGFPVVMITGHGDVALAMEAIRAGVCDFIEKPFDQRAIFRALAVALDGAGPPSPGAGGAERIDELSERERRVLQAMVGGQSSKQIALELGLGADQVELCRASIMTKLQISTLSDLVRLALAVNEAGPPK